MQNDIKNGVSIREGSLTHYGGPHKVFWEIVLVVLGVTIMG